MDSIRRQARVAGLLYFLIGITAPLGLMVVPDALLVSGDAAATADRIRASEWLLRLGIASELIHQVIMVFLVTVASIFWGLWLFPFGIVALRSGFIPRVFGILLFFAGAGYLASAFTTLVLPAYAPAVNPVAMVLEFAEVPIIFWLLIAGAREPRSATPAA